MVNRLEIIGSNCINLLSGPVNCDLTNRDFSFCSISYAQLHKRDLSGCKFNHTTMDNCSISESKLDNC
jgi:uncharacterized protein YjbI with pentapeptide repeats